MRAEHTVSPFQIGAMYWQNPNHGKARIEEDLRRIRENRLSIIRKFVWWEAIESQEGEFDFRMHDLLYEAAEKEGIRIMESFGLYPPHWLKVQLGRRGIIDTDRYYCLDRPEVREPLKRFIGEVVNRYKDSPALAIWNVWNEPTKPPCHCRHTREKFIDWLRRRYGSIEALREAWLGEYQVFTTVCPGNWEQLTPEWLDEAFRFGLRGRITPLEYDWTRFSTVNLTDNIAWLVEETRRIDPHHETHANPNCPTGNGIMDGQDVHLQAGVLDSISESVHPSHHFNNERDVDKYPVCHSFSADKIKSWGKAYGKDAWIGELQAGTTYFHRKQYTPSGADLTHVLWQSLGRGLRGVLFWEWQAWRSSMMEVGEFSLRAAAGGGPTERSEAVRRVGEILDEYQEEFRQLKRPPSRAAILYSMDTSNYKALKKRARSYLEEIEHEHTYAAYGCYKALNRANLAVDFVTESQLADGVLGNYRVLYMPGVELVSRSSAEAIRQFVHEGGHLWADGRCAFLDEHVFLRETIPGHGLDEVFGCRESDFVAARGEPGIHLQRGGRVRGHGMLQYLQPSAGEVLARHDNGQPAIVRNHYGKGLAEIVGSRVTLGLRSHSDEATMDYLAGFAAKAGLRPRVTMEPATGFEACFLEGETCDVIIVSNLMGEAARVRIRTPEAFVAVDCPMDGSGETQLNDHWVARFFQEGETAVILCRKEPHTPMSDGTSPQSLTLKHVSE